ncbi:MAG: putative porin [Steroidobacteraceae bacterium]
MHKSSKNGTASLFAPAKAFASVLVLATGAPVTARAAADQVSELKAAVEALQKRIDTLESTNDRQTDQIAMVRSNVPSWVPNFTWKGDFRYRNENIEQEFAPDRNRDRIRVRAGFVAKVNDTVKVEIGLSTSEYGGTLTDGGDSRSSNQTLTNGNSRKAIFADLAYAEWQPHADWKFTVGKMKYPWVRAGQSVFFDGDVNPEGLAVNFTHGDFFASSFYNILEERNSFTVGTTVFGAGESTMGGFQFGWKPMIGPGRLTLAAGYFDANSVKNRAPVYVAANGNTTKNTGCFGGGTGCLANDYDLMEVFAQYDFTAIAGRPLSLYLDYVKNDKAINSMDTAYSTGVLYGKASDPRTWEIGFYYAKVEKDSLYGEYIDSDWGAGNTDGKGTTLKFGYAFAKGWTFNGTYFLNKTNMDVAASGTGVPAGTFNRDYKRLQLDLNFKY